MQLRLASILVVAGIAEISIAGADEISREYGRCLDRCNKDAPRCDAPGKGVCVERAEGGPVKENPALARFATCESGCVSNAKSLRDAKQALEAKRLRDKEAALLQELADAKREMQEWADREYETVKNKRIAIRDPIRTGSAGCTWWRDIAACEQQCAAGNPVACVDVANAYDDPGGAHKWANIPNDWAKADAAAERACNLGDPMGCVEAVQTGKASGIYQKDGSEIHLADGTWWPKAYALGKRLCDDGVGRGCTAVVEYMRSSAQDDHATAYTYAQAGCRADDLRSCLQLVVGLDGRVPLGLTRSGGPDRDGMDWNKWGQRAAQLTKLHCTYDPDKCMGAALLYANKGHKNLQKHVKPDPAVGRKLLEELCNKGYQPACVELKYL